MWQMTLCVSSDTDLTEKSFENGFERKAEGNYQWGTGYYWVTLVRSDA